MILTGADSSFNQEVFLGLEEGVYLVSNVASHLDNPFRRSGGPTSERTINGAEFWNFASMVVCATSLQLLLISCNIVSRCSIPENEN